jgi:small subunit ribosomal protein S16
MAVKIRMKRMGRSHLNVFRVNAVDSRSPRDGRVIEQLGHYAPEDKDASKQFVVDLERCKYWLDNGAIPSETVSSLLKKQGLEHKGLVLPKPGKPKPKVEEKKKEEAKA